MNTAGSTQTTYQYEMPSYVNEFDDPFLSISGIRVLPATSRWKPWNPLTG